MRNFINVLYRRILYKIPLKWLLIMLAVFAICFSSFSNAGLLSTSYGNDRYSNSYTHSVGEGGILCVYNLSDAGFYLFNGNSVNISSLGPFYCFQDTNGNTDITYSRLNGANFTSSYLVIPGSSLNSSCPACPVMSSLECQTEYNLIPISSVDSGYCESNNLCQVCPDIPEFTGTLSNLYINDIFHIGAPIIQMNIPEEIDWDYAYTNSGYNMNIDVVGYNVDYTKVQEQIDIQNYKPDNEDLTNIISTVLPLFVPGLCIILLLYFIFRFIKKIF